MNWSKVPGATGRVSISHREYKGQKYNEVRKFLEPKPATSWTEGQF